MRLFGHFLFLTGLLSIRSAVATPLCANVVLSQPETEAHFIDRMDSSFLQERGHYKPEDFTLIWKGIRKEIKGARLISIGSSNDQRLAIKSAIQSETEKMNSEAIPKSKLNTSNYAVVDYFNHLPLGQGQEFLVHSNLRTGKVIIESLSFGRILHSDAILWDSELHQIVIDVKDGYWRRSRSQLWTPGMKRPNLSGTYRGPDGERVAEDLVLEANFLRYMNRVYLDFDIPDLTPIRIGLFAYEKYFLMGDAEMLGGESQKEAKERLRGLRAEYTAVFDTTNPRLKGELSRHWAKHKDEFDYLKNQMVMARDKYLKATHFRNP